MKKWVIENSVIVVEEGDGVSISNAPGEVHISNLDISLKKGTGIQMSADDTASAVN